MGIFRTIMMTLAGTLGVISAVMFTIYIVRGDDEWMPRARAFGRWCWAAVLVWFNIEIWRHVALIIINW
ncbi:MAG: hypothetical protein MUC74_03355 [Ideonella sp.]|jgi:hypothetical protein|nr:hypothetical protein [Ideonella sp.]